MAKEHTAGVLVVGIGRFGASIALTLERLGQDVLAVDSDPAVVAYWSGRFPVVEANCSNVEALEQLGARDFSVAVVGISGSLEQSVLIAANLVDLNIPQVWAKAISHEHAKILHRIGAHHVVMPEADAGNRVAHLVSGKLLDYIEIDAGFSVVKMQPPREMHGFTLGETQVRKKYGVNVIGVKPPGEEFIYADPTTRIGPNDIMVVTGNPELLERFASRP